MDSKRLTVMVADDDYNICVLIKSLIDWDGLELECVGEYYNGADIFEEIKKTKPNIVLTDINMPGLDGLELVHCVQNMGLATEFILLSGYKSFDYAHTAIKYGIRNYLLKPINKNELKDNLLDIKARIKEKQNAIKERALIKDRLIQDYKVIRRHFMREIVNGQWNPKGQTLEAINRTHATRFKKGVFSIIGFKTDPKVHLTAEQYTAVLDRAGEFLTSAARNCFSDYISYTSEYVLYVLICSSDKDKALKTISDLFERMKDFLSDKAIITAGLSEFKDAISKELIDQVHYALTARIDVGAGNIILFKEEFRPDICKNEAFSQNDMNSLIGLIEIADVPEIEKWFNTQINNGCYEDINAAMFWENINTIINRCRVKIMELFKPQNIETPDRELYLDINNATERPVLLRVVEKWLLSLIGEYIRGNKEHGKWYTRQAKKYIADHYTENIVLEDIAETLYISPVYFSSLFKSEEGINFSEYLIRHRIEAAKRLLKMPEWTISQIAKAVGYSDSSYLTKLFKKKVGVSPKDYRKLHL